MLATFADMFLPIAARLQAGLDGAMVPTVNLVCDFLAPAPLGAWVEGRGELVKATRNLLFVQGVATSDGTPVLRANGIFKLSASQAAINPDYALSNLFALKRPE
jgi:acyl-coenzyme A thioesterase PaaI-like protein